MTLGFIIIRHVSNKLTDYYWKECYSCIRKFYDNPIVIVDDSSNREYLTENIVLQNCTVIYDRDHKGAAELLPYYYFHKLKPFDTAVIIHDGVFIQSKIEFELGAEEGFRFLWSFVHYWDDEIFEHIRSLVTSLSNHEELLDLYSRKSEWVGGFGVMSVIRWDYLKRVNERHRMFEGLLPRIKSRMSRHALERCFSLVMCGNEVTVKDGLFGNIHAYIKWNTTFHEYLDGKLSKYPIVKVWTGR